MPAIRTERRAARSASAAAVLTKATLRAAASLDLTNAALAAALGVSGASVSRLGATREIRPDSPEGERALLFLRAFRSLDALLGGGAARTWFHAENKDLGGVPARLVRSVEGLVNVLQYLDALRGKL
jgi:hypothetical protein